MIGVLSDNALEAWQSAIKDCNFILQGKATLEYRKRFVSDLHNAVELFIKQLMINENDYRVVTFRNIDSDGSNMRKYLDSENLNEYFFQLAEDELKEIRSVEFSKLKEYSKCLLNDYYNTNPLEVRNVINEGLSVLTALRNSETHFMIDRTEFLNENEFIKLHNFMIIFYEILEYYSLMPYFGEAFGEYKIFNFKKERLKNFSYKKAVAESIFISNLIKIVSDTDIYISESETAFGIASCIIEQSNGRYTDDDLTELWIYMKMLLKYNLLEYEIIPDSEYDGYDTMATGGVLRRIRIKQS